ncbi:MAG: hypothetical protein RMJ84_10635 [Sandaracinaceae bacterium]|nr:hypothetical protein [Sandaracinaceae bacterium]
MRITSLLICVAVLLNFSKAHAQEAGKPTPPGTPPPQEPPPSYQPPPRPPSQQQSPPSPQPPPAYLAPQAPPQPPPPPQTPPHPHLLMQLPLLSHPNTLPIHLISTFIKSR